MTVTEKDIELAATLHALEAGYRQYGIPEHMRDGLTLYVMQGIEPGGFMRAVLENDLCGAATQADSINARALREYAQFMFSCMPAACCGSPELVEAWIARGGLRGRERDSDRDNLLHMRDPIRAL